MDDVGSDVSEACAQRSMKSSRSNIVATSSWSLMDVKNGPEGSHFMNLEHASAAERQCSGMRTASGSSSGSITPQHHVITFRSSSLLPSLWEE